MPSIESGQNPSMIAYAWGRVARKCSAAPCRVSPVVRNAVSNLLAELQVADRAAAIVRAREAGLRQ